MVSNNIQGRYILCESRLETGDLRVAIEFLSLYFVKLARHMIKVCLFSPADNIPVGVRLTNIYFTAGVLFKGLYVYIWRLLVAVSLWHVSFTGSFLNQMAWVTECMTKKFLTQGK